MRTIYFQGNPRQVRDIEMKDVTGKVPVQLWQSVINMPIHVGQKVKVKDASLSYNPHYKDMTFAINFKDEFEVIVFFVLFKLHVFFNYMLILSYK